jgi:hypothetical protein
MLRKIRNGAIALTLSAGFAVTAHAQAQCSASGTPATCTLAGTSVSGTMQRIVFLSLTNPAFGLTMPTDVDFAGAGTVQKVDGGAQIATVRSNANWAVTIKGSAWTGTGNTGKAIGDIGWTTDGGATYTPLTAGNVTFTSGAPTLGTAATLGYRTLWSLNTDTPGSYSMALTFVITAP